jgi:hypothetical protein
MAIIGSVVAGATDLTGTEGPATSPRLVAIGLKPAEQQQRQLPLATRAATLATT